MTNYDDVLLAVVVALVVVCACLVLQIALMRLKRRTVELETAKQALASHYDAMSMLVDDPATPTVVLEFLEDFSEVISRREVCNRLVKSLVTPDTEKGSSVVMSEIVRLQKSRPDLVENFNKALMNGIVVVFARWPGNFSKLPQMVAILGDPKKDVQIAYRFAKSARADFRLKPAIA